MLTSESALQQTAILINFSDFPAQIFGPVQCIFSFNSQQEAVERANSSQYGLVSAVFTKSMDRALAVSAALEAGTVWWVSSIYINSDSFSVNIFKQTGLANENVASNYCVTFLSCSASLHCPL